VLDRVLKTISRYSMLAPGDRVVVAVSGGADSVCLLHMLRDAGVALSGVAHFNHKLRGEASEEDERFVAALAEKITLPFYRAEMDLHGVRDNLEQAGRRARGDFFRSLIRDGAGTRVALGHTRDDQAETVLFRLLRGSGLAGLAGIHPVTTGGFIRPFIEVTRIEIEAYLSAHDVAWREDSSNREMRFARNRIRHELLPQLARDWNPRIGKALAHLADLAYEEEQWWDSALDPAGAEVNVEKLTAVPRAMARRTVRRAIAAAKGSLRGVEFEHVERILDLAASPSGDGRVQVPGLEVTRSFDWLQFARLDDAAAAEPVCVVVPGTYDAPDGTSRIRFEVESTGASGCANLKSELAARMKLRAWRPGDHYRPVGKSRDQNIREMFQTARIPSWRRQSWPIVEREGKILWARGFGAAADSGAGNQESPVLRIWDGGEGAR
jgi:tRNA(Ile)-lysidine synthase